jgi:hypothetical protein
MLYVTMAAGNYTWTVFVEIYSADVYRGYHAQHSHKRVDIWLTDKTYQT